MVNAKRAATAFMALALGALCAFSIGCSGGSNTGGADSNPASSEQAPAVIEVTPGVPIESETATLVIESESCEWAKDFHPSEGSIFVWSAGDNETFAVIRGTLTNNSNEDIRISSLGFKFTFDDELTYDEIETDTLNDGKFALNSTLEPKATKSICVGSKIPDSVKDSYTSLAVTFEIDGKQYAMHYGQTSAAAEPHPAAVALGEPVTTAEYEMVINDYEWMLEVLPPSPTPGMNYIGYGKEKEGMTWLVLKGTLTNNTNAEVDPSSAIKSPSISLGDKQYTAKLETLRDESSFSNDDIVPGEAREVYVYASIPNDVKDAETTAALAYTLSGQQVTCSVY